MPRKPSAPPGAVADVPLAPRTTLGLGGPARRLVEAHSEAEVVAALRWAAQAGAAVAVLGGGSNVVVADAGFDGLVLSPALRGVRVAREDDRVLLTAAAATPWDGFVACAVAEGLAGVECLAGIPGTVGATPVQNVGAYGQEVADTIRSVRVLDRATLRVREVPAAACGFGYRSSRFRRRPESSIVLAVTFALRPGGEATVRYPELARALDMVPGGAPPPLATVRETVLALRRSKSMVLAPGDPNRRSAGSFFTNPVVSAAAAARVASRALRAGLVEDSAQVPRFAAEDGRVKLAAGWLIERAGIEKGMRRGAVGVSSRHALALVHHGGGTTAELVALAAEIQERVHERFGVRLAPEPVFVGFGEKPLWGAVTVPGGQG